MSDAPDPKTAPRKKRSRLRWAGLILVSLCAVDIAAASTYQILRATLFPEETATDFTCRTGTRALYDSVQAASAQANLKNLPERQALEEFRNELEPTWSQASAVRILCEKAEDHAALSALRSVQLLRYAEERAVRTSALDLTRVRERTPKLVRALESSKIEN